MFFLARMDSLLREQRFQRAGIQPELPRRDLTRIVAGVSNRHFGGAYNDVTWCFVRGRTLASIVLRTRLIQLHNVLNASDVPDYVFAMIIFHEMLHIEIPELQTQGKKDAHPPAFRKAERERSPHLDEAWKWIVSSLPIRRRKRLQCTDVVPQTMRLTNQQRVRVLELCGVFPPKVLRADDPASRGISKALWIAVIRARWE